LSKLNSISKTNAQSTERRSGRVLRFGVWVSAGFMIAGLFLAAVFPSTIIVSSSNPTLGDLFWRLFGGSYDPATLMFAGLVFLMLTPVLRVITAIFGFLMEHDWRFVFVSCVVLVLLAGEIVYSIFLKG
jgi:uncharacterized membrane protein